MIKVDYVKLNNSHNMTLVFQGKNSLGIPFYLSAIVTTKNDGTPGAIYLYHAHSDGQPITSRILGIEHTGSVDDLLNKAGYTTK